MAGNGEVELYYGCTEGGYKGTHSRTETYALHNISWTPPNADGVAVATFNDEETLHSLSPSLTTEVFVVLEHAARCAGVKVLVWTAAGERAFCSGAALKGDRTVHVPAAAVAEYLERGMAPAAGDMVMANQTLAFWDFPKPIVGAINGLAVRPAGLLRTAHCGCGYCCCQRLLRRRAGGGRAAAASYTACLQHLPCSRLCCSPATASDHLRPTAVARGPTAVAPRRRHRRPPPPVLYHPLSTVRASAQVGGGANMALANYFDVVICSDKVRT